jgi:ADP-heptose:LPS heptosyltransferase
LAAAGFTLEPARFDLRVPDDAKQWAEKEITGQPIHFSISASSPVKEWPLENWIGLTQLLMREKPPIPIVATAGANSREQAKLKELTQATTGAPVQCLEGLSVARLAAALQRCRLHVGGDSGALHLAMALGISTVTVFRRYKGLAEWIPPGAQHRNVMVDCRCIAEKKDACLMAGRSECLGSITPQQVFAEIGPILK